MFQTKRYLAFAAIAALFFSTSTLFMNCGGGSLPSAVQDSSSSSSQSALQGIYNPNPAYVGDAINITGSNGKPPYTFSVISGSGTLTGNVYQSPAAQETADIRITDAAGAYADVLVTFQTRTSAALVVTPGTASYSSAGSFDFAIPPYNSLTVEVWGGGGGGQICQWFSGCSEGSSGGDTTFDILKGAGGANYNPGTGVGGDVNLAGETGNWNGTNCPGLGGASGGPLGTATREGKTPGGGGDGACNYAGANGGGGGGYARKTYAPGAFAVGSIVSGKVGAGGSVGGAAGQVRFTWQ